MIRRAAASALEWAASRRRRAWEWAAREAAALQERTLLGLVAAARDTEFGRAHDFGAIRTVSDYQARVPMGDYLGFAPLWRRAADGEADVTWPGRVRHWVKTSGTTAGDKYIPVTPAALASHRRGGWDALYLAVEKVGAAHLLGGPMLFLGGSSQLLPHGTHGLVGDLSGLVVRRLPPGLRRYYSPGPALAALPDWESRLAGIAALTATQDLRLVSGMPSWVSILFERVMATLRAAGRPVTSLQECWPNLQVFIHGGVAFPPYAQALEAWMGRPLHRVEVYPASEGFVGMQTEAGGGLTLMLDYGIFYEFIPTEDLGQPRPRRHTVADLVIGQPYAVALSSPAGLWSYLLGDTVRFLARDPLRLQIVGRTRHFVNAFGENVIVEEVEQALLYACAATGAEAAEFSVAPRYPTPGEPRGCHEWLVEFRRPPRDRAEFVRAVDAALTLANKDYQTKRRGDVGMLAPRLVPLPAGTFHRWMREEGKLGDQHKVPRATNDRRVADALLALRAVASTPEVPLPA